MREVLGDREDQTDRVFGGRNERSDRRIADHDSGRGGGRHIDVVIADSDTRDHAERGRQRERVAVPRPNSARDDRVGPLEPVVATRADEHGPPLDEVEIRVGERMVDEQHGEVGRGGHVSERIARSLQVGDRYVRTSGVGTLRSGNVAAAMSDHDPGTPRVDQEVAADVAVTDQRLARYRSSIDNIDAALVHLLAERFKITQDVGRYKAATGLPPADPEREATQVARLRALAEESGLDPVFSEKFLRFIVAEVIHHHQRIAEQEQPTSD